MAFDPQKLLEYPIPVVRQDYGRRDTAFYALSVGMGQEPLDREALRYVDPDGQLEALPSMAVVLGYPGFWMANPETSVNAGTVLHGEQRIIIHRPLPTAGTVTGTTKVTRILDKGPGKGALVYATKSLVDDRTGELLAETISTSFLRGEGGFGGDTTRPEPPPSLPDFAPDFSIRHAVRPEQALYYRLNGDFNPIHSNPERAAKAGFRQPILHGLCTLGIAAGVLVRTLAKFDASRITEIQARFTAPVFPGETLEIEVWRSGEFRVRSATSGNVVVDNGRCVLGS